MSQADEMMPWIATDYGVDQWIAAAAHAGDTRAMRCIALRVSCSESAEYFRKRLAVNLGRADYPGLPDEDSVVREADRATQRESLRWHIRAVHGPPSAHAEAGQGIAGAVGLELCRTGARNGSADCMLLWAGHLSTLGPFYQAEAMQWRQRARDERERQDALLFPPRDSISGGGGPGGDRLPRLGITGTIVIIAVVTSAVVPFIQAMITKAAEDSYKVLRQYLRRLFRQNAAGDPDERDQLLVIRPPGEQLPGAVLQIWTDLPDEAIAALGQLLYDMRNTHPAEPCSERRWYWNSATRRWQIL